MIDLHRIFRVVACGLVLVLSFATVARAQLQPAVPGSPLFAQRIADLDINVFTRDGEKYSGVFTISGDNLLSQDQTFMIPFDQIRRVEKNSYRMRIHSLIGLGVGAGLGITAMANSGCRSHRAIVDGHPVQVSSNCGFLVALAAGSAGVGAALGSAVGGILNGYHAQSDLIFERPSAARKTIAFAPMLSPIKKGIAFTIKWR